MYHLPFLLGLAFLLAACNPASVTENPHSASSAPLPASPSPAPENTSLSTAMPSSSPSFPSSLPLQNWTLEQKIGQTMIVGFDGLTVDNELRHLITDYHIGGVILFARNIQSPRQVAQLTNELQQIALQSGNPGLFIAIDQEGGRVARLTEDKGFTEFPSAMALSATGDPENAYRAATLLAIEMRAVGINVDFAPVLDVNNNPANPIIGIRSFSSVPQQVKEYGLAFARGLEQNGVLAFGKHFPGHGDTSLDSHLDLPTIPHDRNRLDQIELLPFRAFIEHHFSGIMTAHITFPAIDSQMALPATLSRAVLTGLLREELGFQGVIVTDSLEMGALTQSGYPPEKGAPLALAAGADLLLFNRDHAMHRAAYQNLLQAVREGSISLQQLDASVERILTIKQKFGILAPSPIDLETVSHQVGLAEHRESSRQMAAQALTLLRDPQNLLPLHTPPLIVEPEAARGAGTDLYSGATILEVDTRPSDAQCASVLHAAQRHQTVLLLLNDLDRNPQQMELLEKLVQEGLPVIALLHRNPFDAALVPASATVLITYGLNPPMLDAIRQALSGQIAVRGVLPVSLP